MATNSSSKKVIYAALAGNLLVAVTKFIAAFMTGSSSMISEGVHSLVDTGNEALLLYGYSRAGLRPDAHHPLGYGRELYFWSFIVALLLFALGAGVRSQQPGFGRPIVLEYLQLMAPPRFLLVRFWRLQQPFLRGRAKGC